MRILLDECVNPRVREAFPQDEVRTVREMGWGGIKNGKLLALSHGLFDVFLTLDQNIEYQQNISRFRFGFLVVKVPDNKISSYLPLFSAMADAAQKLRAGEIVRISHPDCER